jgi:hypothetical protein
MRSSKWDRRRVYPLTGTAESYEWSPRLSRSKVALRSPKDRCFREAKADFPAGICLQRLTYVARSHYFLHEARSSSTIKCNSANEPGLSLNLRVPSAWEPY